MQPSQSFSFVNGFLFFSFFWGGEGHVWNPQTVFNFSCTKYDQLKKSIPSKIVFRT
jgi:hypothetical protein